MNRLLDKPRHRGILRAWGTAMLLLPLWTAWGPRASLRVLPPAVEQREIRPVVLIDDVSTTGATLDACASALKRAGVKEVRGLTAARVGGRG